MKKIIVLSLLCNATVWSHKTCESYDFANPFEGRYCPTDGIIIPNLQWHQCKLFCLETSNCQSINYNFTDNICTYFITTCPKAISNPGMAFVLFTGKQFEQCIEWIPKKDGHPKRDDRSVTIDNLRFAARMQKDGNDLVGHQLHSICYSRDEAGKFESSYGYPCQYLRIRDGCTVYLMNYELGNPLPSNSLIGGYTSGGLPVYIAVIGEAKAIKSYIPGSNKLGIIGEIITQNVRLLVSL